MKNERDSKMVIDNRNSVQITSRFWYLGNKLNSGEKVEFVCNKSALSVGKMRVTSGQPTQKNEKETACSEAEKCYDV